jgi:hypothetical protein
MAMKITQKDVVNENKSRVNSRYLPKGVAVAVLSCDQFAT